jgi:hypothetical protein
MTHRIRGAYVGAGPVTSGLDITLAKIAAE